MSSDIVVILGISRKDGNTRQSVETAFGSDQLVIDLGAHNTGAYDYAHRNADDNFIRIVETLMRFST